MNTSGQNEITPKFHACNITIMHSSDNGRNVPHTVLQICDWNVTRKNKMARRTLEAMPTGGGSRSRPRMKTLDNIHSPDWSSLRIHPENVMKIVSDRILWHGGSSWEFFCRNISTTSWSWRWRNGLRIILRIFLVAKNECSSNYIFICLKWGVISIYNTCIRCVQDVPTS